MSLLQLRYSVRKNGRIDGFEKPVRIRVFLVFGFLLLCIAFLPSGRLAGRDRSSPGDQILAEYHKESQAWRYLIIRYVLEGELKLIRDTLSGIDNYNDVLLSYIELKRPGRQQAARLYQRNLENRKRVLAIRKKIDSYRKNYPGYTKAFFRKYTLASKDFKGYADFSQTYDNLMNSWRQILERAVKEKSPNTIRQIQEDMILLQLALRAYELFPGEAAGKAEEILKMSHDLRFAVRRLRYYIRTMSAQ